jgi:tetratricopeptide (TPR) repeat protein
MDIDRRMGAFRAQEEILYVWSGKHLERMFPGFEPVLADLYWLRTVQYYGGQRAYATRKRFDLLQPLTEITVTLDPHFEIAYSYGATFLAEPYPIGAGQPEAAVELLERGVSENPDAWILWQNLGLFRQFFLHDGPGAAEILMTAAKRPGAPLWMEPLAALTLTREGDQAAARAIWQSIYDHAEEGPIKTNALTHLKAFDAAKVADQLTELAARFKRIHGRNPEDWREMVTTGLLRAQPTDEVGVPFQYDPRTGQFSVSRRSVLFLRR